MHRPKLVLCDWSMYESSAICCHLADQYPQKELAPQIDSEERSAYLSWLFFGATTLENRVMEVIYAKREGEKAERYKEATEDLSATIVVLENHFKNHNFLCTKFSAADIVVGYGLIVAREAGLIGGLGPTIEYLDRLSKRPAAVTSRVFTAKFPN